MLREVSEAILSLNSAVDLLYNYAYNTINSMSALKSGGNSRVIIMHPICEGGAPCSDSTTSVLWRIAVITLPLASDGRLPTWRPRTGSREDSPSLIGLIHATINKSQPEGRGIKVIFRLK